MRKAIYSSLLFLCLSLSLNAQEYSALPGDAGAIIKNQAFELTPPKLLLPVTDERDEDAVLFRWEQALIPTGSLVSYEFILTGEQGLIYSIKTAETSLLYNARMPRLVKNAAYTLGKNQPGNPRFSYPTFLYLRRFLYLSFRILFSLNTGYHHKF